MNKYSLFIATAGLLAGCARMQIQRRDPGLAEPPLVVREVRVDSFFWGIAVRQAPGEADICGPAGSQRLEMKSSTTDVLLTLVTLGIYVPHRAKYSCVNQNASINGT